MIEKYIQIDPFDDYGQNIFLIDPDVLEKRAEYSMELKDFLDTIKPKQGKVYVLVNAVSAGEYYGPNKNGDYIAEKVLREYHKTFEAIGGIYKHHQNKDPKQSMGRILFSHYNPSMHRVELVLEVDKSRSGKIGERLAAGELLPVSMGLRTAMERCSICGHISRKISERCEHLKYRLNKILDDGRKVYMDNLQAKFFDISFVIIPADRTAGVLKKVASLQQKTATTKRATITKRIPGKVEAVSEDPRGLIYASQPDIPATRAVALGQKYPLNQILSTMLGLRIMPKPMDFQRIVLSYAKQPQPEVCVIKIVKNRTRPIAPDDVHLANFNEKIAHELEDLVPERSLTKPLVLDRIIKYAQEPMLSRQIERSPSVAGRVGRFVFGGEKEDPLKSVVRNPVVPLSVLSGLFYGYSRLMNKLSPLQLATLERLVLKHKWLLPLFVGASSLGTVRLQEHLTKTGGIGTPLKTLLLTVPATYLYSGLQEHKVRKGEPIGDIQNIIRKHPLLSSLALTGSGIGLYKFLKTASYRSLYLELGQEKFDKLYSAIIGT